jgi:diguanylate cyclase (GGDEF)-like protein
MRDLTPAQTHLLLLVLREGGPWSARENRAAFRVAHKDELVDIDDLEQRGLLLHQDNKCRISLLALAALAKAKRTDAASIYGYCDHVMMVLQRLLSRNPPQPDQTFGINEIAADLPTSSASEHKIQEAIAYLSDAALFASIRGPVSAAQAVMPGENLVRFKDLDAVVEFMWALRESHQNLAGQRLSPPREKDQDFGILDAKRLLPEDLKEGCGILGRAVLFIDLDNFGELNSEFTNVVVDDLILQPVQRRLVQCVDGHGCAYGQGGDEFTVLLNNCSKEMAIAFAETVRTEVASMGFEGKASKVHLSASVGLAHGGQSAEGQVLLGQANEAENYAKDKGRNCVVLWTPDGCRLVPNA